LSTAPGGGALGSSLNDTAHVTGGFHPSGSVTFSLYGPSDQACKIGRASWRAVDLASGAAATSDGPVAQLAGTYRWTASYGGDANNESASSGCAAEPVEIAKASPSLVTAAGGGALGAPLNDTAHVTGGFHPSGNVVFSLYGPSDQAC